MKMSKKTRIISVLLCIAVMMGIMSVGMFANAANSETPGFKFTTDIWGVDAPYYTLVDGGIHVDTSAAPGVQTNQWQIGSWAGSASSNNVSQFYGKDGVVFAVKLDEAAGVSGTVTQLNVALKLWSGGTCFISGQAITVGSGVQQFVFPFEGFSADGNAALVMTEEHVNAISDATFAINSYGVYWGSNVGSLKFQVSPIYGYEGEAEVVSIPGVEEETTAEPTTAEPTTEAPTTVAPAPTTQAPAPTTVAPAPTTTVTEVKAATPAKVKKVTAKSKAKKKVQVTWKTAKNAKKYAVKYSYKKNMKKAKTVTVKKAKATLKKLKSGKKVYIQVRGINGKVVGKWSAKKSVKVK